MGKNLFFIFCVGFTMVGREGLHRETGTAPKLYRVGSIKSIGLEPKPMEIVESCKVFKGSG